MLMDAPFTVDELKRYSRQVYLPEVGYQGQIALKNATVLVVGLGGLGSPCSLYLNASGVGKLILIDDDLVELSNLQRQIIHSTKNIKIPKTDSATQLLNQLNPNTVIETIHDTLNPKNADKIIARVDIVLDCSDNFDTRYFTNNQCLKHKKPLISASVIAFNGQLCCFDFRQTKSPCYACLFPQNHGNQSMSENCSDVGVLATAAGIMGVMQANEAIKMLMGLPTLTNRLLLMDTLSLQQRIIHINADQSCQCQNQ